MTRELTQLREVHAIQGRDGCWDIDDYMLGMYNGLELALSIMENRAPAYRKMRKWTGLTDKEVEELAVYPMNPTADLVRAIEKLLKDKNNV
jgi:hypothetical protein